MVTTAFPGPWGPPSGLCKARRRQECRCRQEATVRQFPKTPMSPRACSARLSEVCPSRLSRMGGPERRLRPRRAVILGILGFRETSCGSLRNPSSQGRAWAGLASLGLPRPGGGPYGGEAGEIWAPSLFCGTKPTAVGVGDATGNFQTKPNTGWAGDATESCQTKPTAGRVGGPGEDYETEPNRS